MDKFQVMAIALTLSPLARKILGFMEKNGSITAREAYLELQETTSGSLTRRISEMREAGIPVKRVRKLHPVTGRRYTRYSVQRPKNGAS